jgi:hypothetical protein
MAKCSNRDVPNWTGKISIQLDGPHKHFTASHSLNYSLDVTAGKLILSCNVRHAGPQGICDKNIMNSIKFRRIQSWCWQAFNPSPHTKNSVKFMFKSGKRISEEFTSNCKQTKRKNWSSRSSYKWQIHPGWPATRVLVFKQTRLVAQEDFITKVMRVKYCHV